MATHLAGLFSMPKCAKRPCQEKSLRDIAKAKIQTGLLHRRAAKWAKKGAKMNPKTRLDNFQFPTKALDKKVKATRAVPRVALTLRVKSQAVQRPQPRGK